MAKKGGHRFQILSKGLRRKRGEMNKTEKEYSLILTADPEVYEWWFEPFTLRISHPDNGQPAKVTPDFLVLMNNGHTIVIDVKSSGLDDYAAGVRMKAAAELYPLWRFQIIKKKTKKDGGGWRIQEV